jgi:hypothetical protein
VAEAHGKKQQGEQGDETLSLHRHFTRLDAEWLLILQNFLFFDEGGASFSLHRNRKFREPKAGAEPKLISRADPAVRPALRFSVTV